MDNATILPLLLASTVLSSLVAGGLALAGQALANRNLRRQAEIEAIDSSRQRIKENSEFMMLLVAVAHGSPPDGRTGLAQGEQFAAIELIVTNAVEYPALRPAAEAFLYEYVVYARDKLANAPQFGTESAGWQSALSRGIEASNRLANSITIEQR